MTSFSTFSTSLKSKKCSQPSLRHRAFFSAPVSIPMTRKPIALASCTPMCPTPPPDPGNTTQSPVFRPAATSWKTSATYGDHEEGKEILRTLLYIVAPLHIIGPAVKSSTPSGILVVYFAGLVRYCWYVPNSCQSFTFLQFISNRKPKRNLANMGVPATLSPVVMFFLQYISLLSQHLSQFIHASQTGLIPTRSPTFHSFPSTLAPTCTTTPAPSWPGDRTPSWDSRTPIPPSM
jgi:hypothetical protein